jgi:hypothetical protein
MEGWFNSGTLAQRNNNPGNLRASSLATGTDSRGFAIFPDADTGWAALDRQLEIDASRGLTLASFIQKYAPSSEHDTAGYLSYLVNQLGTGANTLLKDLVGSDSNSPAGTSGEFPQWTWPTLPDISIEAPSPWVIAAAAVALVSLLTLGRRLVTN